MTLNEAKNWTRDERSPVEVRQKAGFSVDCRVLGALGAGVLSVLLARSVEMAIPIMELVTTWLQEGRY